MIELHIVLFLLSFLVWKIVYIALIIDYGVNGRIAAIEAQGEKLSLAIDKENKDRVATNEKENKTLIAAIEAQGEKLSLAIIAHEETLSKVINNNTMQNKIQRDFYVNDIEGVFNEIVSLKNSVYRLEEMMRTELRTIFQLK